MDNFSVVAVAVAVVAVALVAAVAVAAVATLAVVAVAVAELLLLFTVIYSNTLVDGQLRLLKSYNRNWS